MGITPKVFLLTFLCFETLIVLVAVSFSRHSSAILMESQMSNARQTVQKSNGYLELNLQNIRTTLASVINDRRLQDGNYRELETWISTNLIYLTPAISNLHLLSNGAILASSSSHRWDLLEDPFLREALLSRKSGEAVWVGPYYSKVSGYTLTYISDLRLQAGQAGLLLADVNLERLYYSMLPNEPSAVTGEIMLLDAAMKPVIGKAPYIQYDFIEHLYDFDQFEPELLRRDWAQTEAYNPSAAESLILTRGFNEMLQWQIVLVISKSELLAPLKQSLRYSWLLAGISFLLSLGLSLFVTFLISRPIKRITDSVKEVGKGNLNASLAMDREDEIGYLAKQFNLMTRKVGQLMTDLKDSEEQKKQSDFRALHAQIKPHFLYNTLNTISMLGRRGEAERMDQLISALTNQLHYVLDNSPDPVSLREELAAVENYLELMKSRYPDKCSYEMDIDPLSLEFRLPKFILQPLVENALFHGIVPGNGGGQIYIGTMVAEDDWEIVIEDNGVGMAEEMLRDVREKLAQSGGVPPGKRHIGLLNIHERFRLMFGDDYSIYIASEPRVGTKIWIRLARKGGEGHDDEASAVSG
jgi:sensor histidine kinase YesM